MCLRCPKKAAWSGAASLCTTPGPRAAKGSPPFSNTIIIENLCQEIKILFLKPLGNLEMPLHRACRQALPQTPACSRRYLQSLTSAWLSRKLCRQQQSILLKQNKQTPDCF